MRIFVLSTGRSGTTTFARACSHITNYTSGHETKASQWRKRLAFPDQHIEVDHRLAHFLGTLDKRYGDEPIYVHLRRDPEQTAASWSVRKHRAGQMRTWPPAVVYMGDGWPSDLTHLQAARIMVQTMIDNIELFLRDKTKVHEIWIENPRQTFDDFWDAIDAEGDRNKAHAELRVRHNARKR